MTKFYIGLTVSKYERAPWKRYDQPEYKRLRAITLNRKWNKVKYAHRRKSAAVKTNTRGGYLQRSQFLLHLVEKPTHKGGYLGQRKSIRRAITSKSKGLEPKSEFGAFPPIKRLGNLAKNTQSITKLFQCTPSLQHRVQKQEDFHKERMTVPLALHNSMCFNTLINRHTGGQIQLFDPLH